LPDAGLDAELIRLGRERNIAHVRANTCNADGTDADDFEDLCADCRDLEFAIQDIPAQTIAGLAVKARIAAEYAIPVDPDQPLLDDMINSLIEDILRSANVSAKSATTLHGEG
jgi:hypothetical protein